MKRFYLASLLTLVMACTQKKPNSVTPADSTSKMEVIVPAFQTIIDAANVAGAILIYDLAMDQYYSNDFAWTQKGNLPASTFKIAHTMIALETGIVENDSTLFKWEGEKRSLSVWEQDLIFRDAFHFSCVPCYQEIARKIGVKMMIEYLDKLDYGNMKVDATSIDKFWLEGESKITQFQQIDFLKRFYQSGLPISERTEVIMKRLMVIEENDNYKLSGKTGWSITGGNDNGWFVGYIESQNSAYFFATNVEPKESFDMELFPSIRKELTLQAMRQMKVLE